MARMRPTESEIEDRFFHCLKGTGRGISYTQLVRTYAERTQRTERTAKTHLKWLVEGISAGRITDVSRYKGFEGWLYGTPEDDTFCRAREVADQNLLAYAASIPPKRDKRDVTIGSSPFTFFAGRYGGRLVVSGKGVNRLEISDPTATFVDAGQTSGMFTLAGGEMLRVSYSSPPKITLFPPVNTAHPPRGGA